MVWTGLLLVLLEIGLRAGGLRFEGSFYQPDPVCYTSFRPNAAGWILEGENFCRINSLGMRDRERAVSKPENTIRVAVLGDSITAAQQVPLEDTMAQVIERTLSRAAAPAGYRAEVLNFAVGGYTVGQMYLTLREKVWKFQPDVVVVFLSEISVRSASRRSYHVDTEAPFFVYRGGELLPDPDNSPPPEPSAASLKRSGLVKDLYNRCSLLQLGMAALKTGVPKLLPHHASAEPVAANSDHSAATAETWQVAEGLLDAMQAGAREHNAELWVMAHGAALQVDPDEGVRRKNAETIALMDDTDRRVGEYAAARGIPFLATAPPLRDWAVQHGILLHGFFNTPRNEGHLNVAGNRAAGELVSGRLLAQSSRLQALLAARRAAY